MTTSIHIKAIDWALAQGYFLSVRDYSEEEFDLKLSQDRAEIIDACEATEMPNVYITEIEYFEHLVPKAIKNRRRIAVFSVIDEGIPDETINDYIAKPGGEFDTFFNQANH
jgi:hypothetical protein